MLVVPSSPLQQTVPRELLASFIPRYELAATFDGARFEGRLIYDQQDEFYLPVAGFRDVIRPSPNLAIFIKRRR